MAASLSRPSAFVPLFYTYRGGGLPRPAFAGGGPSRGPLCRGGPGRRARAKPLPVYEYGVCGAVSESVKSVSLGRPF